MKTKYAALILLAAGALAVNSFADDRRPLEVRAQTIQIISGQQLTNEVHSETIKIISHVGTVEKLSVTTKSPVRIEGGVMMVGPNGRMKFVNPDKGSVSVRIDVLGGSPILIEADEAELVPQPITGMLLASQVPSAE
jgi:hypothetical protein